jgi:hypothetical protein
LPLFMTTVVTRGAVGPRPPSRTALPRRVWPRPRSSSSSRVGTARSWSPWACPALNGRSVRYADQDVGRWRFETCRENVDSGDRNVSGLTVAELLAVASEPPPTLNEKIAYLEARGDADAREWLKGLAERRAAARQELERRAAA